MRSKVRGLEDRRQFLRVAAAAAAGLVVVSIPVAAGAVSKLKIGFIGSGKIGGALGSLWYKAGHEIMFSSLDLEHDKQLAAGLGPNAHAGTTRDAAAFGDAVLIAIPYAALPKVGKEIADLIKGKIVIDTCNPIVARDGEIATWARERGAGLASAELLSGARLVRAFNAIGYARLPEAGARGIGMPIAGDDADALEVASGLVREIGLEPVVVGGLAMGRYLIPGTPLAGEHTAAQIKEIAATLK